METVDAVPPLRRPAVVFEYLLQSHGRLVTFGLHHPAIEQHRQTLVVRHPAIARKPQNLRITRAAAAAAHSALARSASRPQRAEPQAAKHGCESTSVHWTDLRILIGLHRRLAGCSSHHVAHHVATAALSPCR